MPNSTQSSGALPEQLTKKQEQVLIVVHRYGRPATELELWRFGCELDFWQTGFIDGHLRRLLIKGLVERGKRDGRYHYEPSLAGRAYLVIKGLV